MSDNAPPQATSMDTAEDYTLLQEALQGLLRGSNVGRWVGSAAEMYRGAAGEIGDEIRRRWPTVVGFSQALRHWGYVNSGRVIRVETSQRRPGSNLTYVISAA